MKNILEKAIPLISVIRNYNTESFIFDLTSALTLTSVIIPQAIAYGLLTGLPPVYGLYTSIIPVIIYALFATSRHLSVGTFALISVLISAALDQVLKSPGFPTDVVFQNAISVPLALSLTFFVGIFKILFAIFGIGTFVSTHLLPDCLVSGLTTSSAFQIIITQVKSFLGVDIPTYNGILSFFQSLGKILISLPNVHVPTFLVGLLTFVLAYGLNYLNKLLKAYYLNRAALNVTPAVSHGGPSKEVSGIKDESTILVQSSQSSPIGNQPVKSQKVKRLKVWINIPDVLLAVLVATIIAYFYNVSNLGSKHGKIAIIGEIPSGFPSPQIPFIPSSLCPPLATAFIPCEEITKTLPSLLWPALKIAIVSSTISFSMIQLYARKVGYLSEIRLNQDLFALGIASILGCILGQGYVPTASMGRTALVVESGAKTIIGSVMTAFLILIVVLTPISSILSYVPLCSLASVIFFAVKLLVWQFGEGIQLLKQILIKDVCRKHRITEALMWWVVFVSIIIFDIALGVIIGMIFCFVVYLWEFKLPRLRKLLICYSSIGSDSISVDKVGEPLDDDIELGQTSRSLGLGLVAGLKVIVPAPSFGLTAPIQLIKSSTIPEQRQSRNVPENTLLNVSSATEENSSIEILEFIGSSVFMRKWILLLLLGYYRYGKDVKTIFCDVSAGSSELCNQAAALQTEAQSITKRKIIIVNNVNIFEAIESIKRNNG